MEGTKVVLSKLVKKQALKLPHHVVKRLDAWRENVESDGIREVRKIPGYHDEPLKGKRKGQRSIRLGIHYRAIYLLKNDNKVEFVSVEEVNKHEY